MHHVIIGGGPAATNAIETIRQFDNGESTITLVSDELAHSRMALPYWLAGQIPKEQTHTGDDAYFKKLKVTTKFGQRVTNIDASAKTVVLDDSSSIEYDNLLLATGSSPLELPIPGADGDAVQPMWNLSHVESALAKLDSMDQPRVVMIGAGFIGFIVLNAMYKRGWKLAVVEREKHVLPRMLNSKAASFVESWLRRKQVDVHCGASVQAIEDSANGKSVKLSDGQSIECDFVVVATGVKPNIELAASAGLKTDHGVIVDANMRTNVEGIYAAGDIAQGPVRYSDTSEVHAIQPTAVDHGRIAGANMAGQSIAYPGSLLMNILDVCGLQCASFGQWEDESADPIAIESESTSVYRQLLFTDDKVTGAIFVGEANNMGMLTDCGMVKGMVQTNASLGSWKQYLQENPFDVRRAYVAARVAEQLAATTLLGRPTQARQFRFDNTPVKSKVSDSHSTYVSTKTS